ncbi:MAG: FtsX-like permease family protein [Candidatus Cryptobacteroides sp.]
MNLPLRFAVRYLFARKSHNVINIISAISSAGIAVGTAALIIIMSVYNGFDGLVRDSLGNVEPDILITPAGGKVFVPDSPAFDWAYGQDEVLNMCSVLEENVFLNYDGRSGIVKAKGVDKVYEEESPLRDHLKDGKFTLHKGEVPLAVVGAVTAASMDISPRFVAPIEMYFPARDRNISLANPAASLEMVKVFPAGVFTVNADVDASLMIVPIETMRELLEYNDEVSSIEIRIRPEAGEKGLRKIITGMQERLGPDYEVRDRFMQNEALYKMMKYEKSAIFLILIFIIILIGFSVFGSLSMLIIEKEDDIRTLRGMGAMDGLINRIFITEGWLISLLGMAAGLATGLGFAFLQQQFGFIRMPGGFTASAYPVIVEFPDVLATAGCVTLIGLVMAYIPVKTNIPAE